MPDIEFSVDFRTRMLDDFPLAYFQDILTSPPSNMRTKKAAAVPARMAEVYQDTKKLLALTSDPKRRTAIAAVHNLLIPFADASMPPLHPRQYQDHLRLPSLQDEIAEARRLLRDALASPASVAPITSAETDDKFNAANFKTVYGINADALAAARKDGRMVVGVHCELRGSRWFYSEARARQLWSHKF